MAKKKGKGNVESTRRKLSFTRKLVLKNISSRDVWCVASPAGRLDIVSESSGGAEAKSALGGVSGNYTKTYIQGEIVPDKQWVRVNCSYSFRSYSQGLLVSLYPDKDHTEENHLLFRRSFPSGWFYKHTHFICQDKHFAPPEHRHTYKKPRARTLPQDSPPYAMPNAQHCIMLSPPSSPRDSGRSSPAGLPVLSAHKNSLNLKLKSAP